VAGGRGVGRTIVRTAAALDAVALGVFAARRVALLAAASLEPRALVPPPEPPSMALLVPLRNEEAVLPRLLAALGRLEYPDGRLHVVLVDDGSEDASAAVVERWVDAWDHARLVRLPAARGKPAALNEALAAAPETELVAVCDADLKPEPQALLRLAEGFGDPEVGAVAGLRWPENGSEALVARYAAMESWVHQLVTSAGKDRLALDPPVLGFGAYRRAALEEIGRFRTDVRAEDVDSTIALSRRGWRTRFAPAAVAGNLVAASFRDYWRQHLRWSSTLLEAAVRPPAPKRRVRALPPLLRVEQALMSAGYVDRPALAAAVGLTLAGRLPRWIAPAYLGIAAVDAVAALRLAGCGRAEGVRYALALTFFFPVDVVASATAVAVHEVRAPAGWQHGARQAAAPGAQGGPSTA
jgi:cellulose synthase/poly-beta-1,6-N-acetylglucosamine synthase-like glycosyltransferase